MEAPEQMDINTAEREILAIRDRVAVMGANDDEIPGFNRLMTQLRRGEISPKDAVSAAFKIEERKVDYH